MPIAIQKPQNMAATYFDFMMNNNLTDVRRTNYMEK